MTDEAQGTDDQQAGERPEVIPFVVNKTPFVCWDWKLKEKNLEFLRSMDPKYFEYVVESNIDGLDGDHKHYAALSIRIAYSQAVETLFGLLGSLIQAPRCSVGWMLAYRSEDLKEFVDNVTRHRKVMSRISGKPVTWRNVAELVLSRTPYDDEKRAWLVEGFGGCWVRLAGDFLDGNMTDEYNSIKHGLRGRLGGVFISVGIEETPGVAAPRPGAKRGR